jgi:type II secretory pathway predicted ATPase ExeA
LPLPSGNALLTGRLWPTLTARKVAHTIEVCHRFGQMGLITGTSGVGKTTAAMAAVSLAKGDEEDTGREIDAHYIMMTAAADTLVSALVRLTSSIGRCYRPQYGANELYEALIRRGWQRHSLLVIDEAQFLPDGALHVLRNLWDELSGFECAPGIVLIGTADLAERVEGRNGRRGREFEALRGRLGAAVKLEPLTSADFGSIVQHLGIVGQRAGEVMERIGRGRGGLHNVRRVERMARQIAGPGNPITLAHIQDAAEVAGVGA